MELIKIVDKQAGISFSYDELLVVNNIFNEVCNGIDVFEFETRIGKSKEEVCCLLKKLGNILDQIEND
ncbi:hypothetical protein [Commensalibacter nepenthis]|uniref:Acyl carrier protein n=1 Tax=Commensalibacter nepenthis TaxID=3043872 RepID=A0ABT6QBN5_9PROT|nr:hypothetical protein [Commensalibacter sp. TBRC 10068]MDI2113730.1 hypothetical protein [Commensalibacter sp. TBRC 10068]